MRAIVLTGQQQIRQQESPSLEDVLPREIISHIFEYLPQESFLSCALTCRTFFHTATMLVSAFKPEIAFGEKEWSDLDCDVGDAPVLYPDIYSILQSPSPFWPGKTIEETCLLCLLPSCLNSVPLTLRSLEVIGQKKEKPFRLSPLTHHLGGLMVTQQYLREIVEEPFSLHLKSYWILMTKNIIPNSANKSYRDQQEILKKYSTQARCWEVPRLIEAVTAIFTHYVKTQQKCFIGNFTRCQEKTSRIRGLQLLTGGFVPNGDLAYSCDEGKPNPRIGVAATMKIYP